MSLQFEVQGVEELARVMRSVRDVRRLEKPFTNAGMEFARYMNVYPPPTSRQTYVRTGRYGREWEVRTGTQGAGINTTYENFAPYSIYVGSKESQARVHRGRWRTDEQGIQHIQPRLLEESKKAIWPA